MLETCTCSLYSVGASCRGVETEGGRVMFSSVRELLSLTEVRWEVGWGGFPFGEVWFGGGVTKLWRRSVWCFHEIMAIGEDFDRGKDFGSSGGFRFSQYV